jgi:hypothetical protein
MSLFKNRFNTILEQETKEPVEELPPTPEEALKAELDPGTDPAALGASPVGVASTDTIANAKQEAFVTQIAELDQWVAKIQEFVDFLNDPGPNSVQTKLHDAVCDSMFEKIASSEHKKIARIAVELSGLVQSLNGFKIAGND